MLRRAVRMGVAGVALIGVAGCASYGEGVSQSLKHVEKGNYEKANKSLEKGLEAEGDDKLLFHLERGAIYHLAGNYKASNRALEKANKLADKLRSKQAEDYLAAAMVSPRQMEYMGNDIERVYINYYKALNYLVLAQKAQDEDKRSQHLESAGVEIRRLDNKLSSMEFNKGSYEQTKKEEEKTFAQLLDIFQKFQGNWLDEEWLVFREDAYARYLAGVLYEKSGELDNARISYRKAAELYEGGYSEQYHLDGNMVQQAWLDTVRIMRKAGGYESESQRLIEQKLSETSRERLGEFGPEKGQVLVIQHLGMVPQRKELNLHLTVHPNDKSLRLKPVLSGTAQEKQDQAAWFFLLYGDKGVMDMLSGFAENGLAGVGRTVTQKTVPLGPAWDLAEQLNIPQNIGDTGIRVTVPYYSPLRTNANGTGVRVNGKVAGDLRQAESVSQLVVQNQLLNAGSDLHAALARATLKNVTAAQAGGMLGGALGKLAGKAVASGSSAAETRSWLTLPYGIRVARFPVESGEHELQLVTQSRQGTVLVEHQKQMSVKAGQTKVWITRTIDPTQERPYNEVSEAQTVSASQ